MESNTTNVTEYYDYEEEGKMSHLWTASKALDKASVWISLLTGIPGNIFIFLTMRTFPRSVARFHFQLLSIMDAVALLLQLSVRTIDWYDLAVINSAHVSIGWTTYFNVTYFTGIYANWVLIYIAVERLIATRYPGLASTYLNVPRAKFNAVFTAILMFSFAVIVIVKLRYFGIPWLVIFTTFYTAFPIFMVFLVLWLLLGTAIEKRRQRKALLKEEKEHHHHHHHQHPHHKNGHKDTPTSLTPTGAYNPGPPTAAASKSTPTMSKSHSGLTKHSGNHNDVPRVHGEMRKHDPLSTSVPNMSTPRTATTFCFTSKKPMTASTQEIVQEPPEVISQKAKDRKEIERCYTCMMLITAVLYLVLTVPYTVIEFIYVTSDREITDLFNERQAKQYFLIMIALTLMYIEHSCNFYAFILCCWRFRAHFKRMITRQGPATLITTSGAAQTKDADQHKTFV